MNKVYRHWWQWLMNEPLPPFFVAENQIRMEVYHEKI